MFNLSSEQSKELQKLMTQATFPGKGEYQSITLPGLNFLADALGCSVTQAMIVCLENEIWPSRFCRNRGIFPALAQARLLKSHAAVIGCGGLGGVEIALLIRLGLGSLTVCDNDSFEESNLNRQLLCNESRLGMNKAIAAKDEINLIASHVNVQAITYTATAENLPEILQGADIVIDCVDTLEVSRLLSNASRALGIPFVHAALAGEEGFVLLETAHGSGTLASLYPDKTSKDEQADRTIGMTALSASAIAVLQCQMVVNTLLGKSETESGVLWHLDLSVPELERFLL